jgi:hypothetical protein
MEFRFIKSKFKTKSAYMKRRNFLRGVAFSPFFISALLSNAGKGKQKEVILVGLSNSGESLVKEFFRLGYKGQHRIIQYSTKDIESIDQLTEKYYLNNGSLGRSHPIFSKLVANKKAHYVFLSGLGGTRSTYLSMLAHHEMSKGEASFEMLLTLPQNYEGLRRNARAKKFQQTTMGDARVQINSLENCPGSYTIKECYSEYAPSLLYSKFTKNDV